MGLPKGRTNNIKGRTTGSKNEKTKQWEALGEAIITTHAQRFNQILESADDDLFARNYLQVIEYFKPKMSRSEGQSTVEVIHRVTFTRKPSVRDDKGN